MVFDNNQPGFYTFLFNLKMDRVTGWSVYLKLSPDIDSRISTPLILVSMSPENFALVRIILASCRWCYILLSHNYWFLLYHNNGSGWYAGCYRIGYVLFWVNQHVLVQGDRINQIIESFYQTNTQDKYPLILSVCVIQKVC